MVSMQINGKAQTADASPDMPLVSVLRDVIGLVRSRHQQYLMAQDIARQRKDI